MPLDKITFCLFHMLLEWMNSVDKKLINLTNANGDTALHLASERTTYRVIHDLRNWEDPINFTKVVIICIPPSLLAHVNG